ncbi:MAG: hypothetical protein RBT34_01960 [Anaerolineaceae bacterium]|jgi:hypothetical protein|nr:hypothetical protein [Anaerolineaceae bacterium]
MDTITLTPTQKKNLRILLLIGLAVFLLFAIPNAQGAENEYMLSVLSQDESFQYPFLVSVLTPGDTLLETIKNFISYQHYIYGYPFYIISSLAVLPSRLIYGAEFGSHVQLNLLLLRQLVSVLPMLIALGFLTWLTTRFKSTFKSVVLFLFLLSVQGVTRQNLHWWHPDAFTFLMIVLTFFFLDRDRLHFGRHFYLAAITCGLAAATKVIGVFFILTIPLYLWMGLRQKKLGIKQAAQKAALFVLLMLLVVLITNPLLLIPRTRADIIAVHRRHNDDFAKGWQATGDTYQRGFLSWIPVLTTWYGQGDMLIFAVLSLVLGALWGKNKMVHGLFLSWVLPYAFYIFYAIANKPDHYMLPAMLPVYACIFTLADIGDGIRKKVRTETKPIPPLPPRKFLNTIIAADLAWAIVLIMLTAQFIPNVQRGQRLYHQAMTAERLLLACNNSPSNDPDGRAVNLEDGRWYLMEDYDYTTDPETRRFTAVRGPLEVQAVKSGGQQVWACINAVEAEFSARERAITFKHNHPEIQVFGPDGVELK